MGSLILRSKTSPPGLREDHIPRPTLMDRLNAGSKSKLTLVIAGAGYGKSSLLAEWVSLLASNQTPIFWYSLDPGDQDPAVFFTYLEAGLQTLESGFKSNIRALINRPAPPNLEQLAQVWLADLESLQQNRPLVFILDDYHRLGEASTIDRGMALILERLPAGVHLAIASRQPPGFSVSRLRAAREVNELETQDLKFNPEEIKTLFPDLEQAPQSAKNLVSRSEGWIAGLQLLRQAFVRFQINTPDNFRGETDNLSDWIFEYLADEIFDRQPLPLQEFLLQTAILNSLSPAECDVIFDRADSAQWLAYLRDHELLTHHLQHDPDTYRYHHLLTDFLRQKNKREGDLTTVQAWHKQASRYYQAHNRWDEAFDLAIQASDEALATEIFNEAFTNMRLSGRIETLLHWLDQISLQTYSDHPLLFSHRGHLWEDQGLHAQAAGAFHQAISLAELDDDKRTLANAYLGLGIIAQRAGEMERAYQAFQNAVEHADGAPPSDQVTALNGLASSYAYSGRYHQALTIYQECLEKAALLNKSIHSVVINNLSTCYLQMGKFSEALNGYGNALAIRQELGNVPGIILCLSNIGMVHTKTGELEKARAALEKTLELGGKAQHPASLANILSNLGDVAAAEGNFAQAEELYRRSIKLKEPLEDYPGLVHTWSRLSELFCWRGYLDEALEYALRALELSAEKTGAAERLMAQTAYALARLALREEITAIESLEPIITAHREVTTSHYELARALWHLSLARARLGQDWQNSLAECLTIADQYNYHYLIQTLAKRYPNLLAGAIAAGIRPPFVNDLAAKLGDALQPELYRGMQSAGDEERQRLVQFMQQLPPVPLRVTSLGRFTLHRGESEIPTAAWVNKKSLAIFMILLAQGDKPVPREKLMEWTWPEDQPDKVSKKLNQAVYFARQILEPYLLPNLSSRYIFSADETYWLKLPPGSSVDDQDFERQIDRARLAYQKGDHLQAATLYQEALALYQGDYMVDFTYVDWFLARQEHVRELALEGLERTSRWSLEKGLADQAAKLASRILIIEPLHEPGYYLLMQAQHTQGQHEAALRTYRRYLKKCCAELEVEPNPDLLSLYDKIRREIRKKR